MAKEARPTNTFTKEPLVFQDERGGFGRAKFGTAKFGEVVGVRYTKEPLPVENKIT